MSGKPNATSTHHGGYGALYAPLANNDDKLSRHPVAPTTSPWADRIDIATAHAGTNRFVEARPGKRDGTADKGRVAGFLSIGVVERRRDAMLLNCLEPCLGAQAPQCVLLPQLKEQRAHLARDLTLDNRKHWRPPTRDRSPQITSPGGRRAVRPAAFHALPAKDRVRT